MPYLTFNLWFSNPPTTTVRVIATRKRGDDEQIITTADFDPPHINPRLITLYVPTYETYIVYVYKNASGVSNGLLINDWAVEPRAEVANIPVDTQMLVGGGSITDPADGAGFFIIPGSEGLVINRIFKLGLGVLPATDWNQISGTDIDGNPAIGFELLGDDEAGDPIVFNEGEQFTVEYKINVDSNASELIAQLSQDLDDHINNHDNPHEVTKSQIGLSNIPNAKSDAINLDSSDTLATSKAVNDLRLSIVDAIVAKGRVDIGLMGGNQDRNTQVTLSPAITGNYIVVGTIQGYSGSWTNDNDATFSVHTLTSTSFYVAVHQMGTSSANYYFNYIIVKI